MRASKPQYPVGINAVMLAAILCFLLTACVALLRDDSVIAHFGSSLFHIDLETQHHQPSGTVARK
jgi:hypothetical protein